MHADKRAEKITGTGGKDKAAVMGILERGPKSVGSKVRVKVIDQREKEDAAIGDPRSRFSRFRRIHRCAEIV